MSLFTSPDDLTRSLALVRRRHAGLSAETIALLENADARELRYLRIARQVWYILVVLPAVMVLASAVGVWLASFLSA